MKKINDYDIFSNDSENIISILKAEKVVCTFETEYFTNFYLDNNTKIQIIKRYSPKTFKEIFDVFDFTIVCGAYDGIKFECHERFFQDIATKRLVINTLRFPLKTLERICKYSRRGYTACPVGLLRLAQSIRNLDIDWNNPDENLLSFYPNGTFRFSGID